MLVELIYWFNYTLVCSKPDLELVGQIELNGKNGFGESYMKKSLIAAALRFAGNREISNIYPLLF